MKAEHERNLAFIKITQLEELLKQREQSQEEAQLKIFELAANY